MSSCTAIEWINVSWIINLIVHYVLCLKSNFHFFFGETLPRKYISHYKYQVPFMFNHKFITHNNAFTMFDRTRKKKSSTIRDRVEIITHAYTLNFRSIHASFKFMCDNFLLPLELPQFVLLLWLIECAMINWISFNFTSNVEIFFMPKKNRQQKENLISRFCSIWMSIIFCFLSKKAIKLKTLVKGEQAFVSIFWHTTCSFLSTEFREFHT